MRKIILAITLIGNILLTFGQAEAPLPLTEAENTLIMAGDTATPMRVFLITQYEDSLLLRTQSQPVKADPADTVLQHFIARLYRTVTDSASMGVGIAAPQVGLLRQIIWVQRFDKEGFPFEAYLNPVIRQYSHLRRDGMEGCLSIPVVRDTVNRAYAILIEYDYPDGSHHIEMVEDFTAVIFQHEIDHLNGIVFTDHLKEEIRQAEEKINDKQGMQNDK
ncbi:MAG: peptide deformylase [Bacteroidia bacterium]